MHQNFVLFERPLMVRKNAGMGLSTEEASAENVISGNSPRDQ